MKIGGGSKNVRDISSVVNRTHQIISLEELTILEIIKTNFKLIKRGIIHVHGPRPLAFLFIFLCIQKFRGTKIVFSPHGFNPSKFKSGIPSKIFNFMMIKIILLLSSAVVCVSASEKRRFAARIKNELLHVIYNGVEITQSNKIIKNNSISNKTKVLLVGRFDKVKNYERLLNIAKQTPSINFYVVGGGMQFEFITNKIHENRLKNIILLGEKLEGTFDYRDYDYFLSLSLSEGMPYTVIEALEAGLWPILTGLDVHLEILEAFKVGTILSNDDTNFLQMLKTLENKEKEIEFPMQFSLQSMGQSYDELYKKI